MNENEIMRELGEISSSVKSAHKRIDEIKDLVESIHKLTVAINNQQTSIEAMSDRLRVIEEKPALPPCQHIADFKTYNEKMKKLENDIEEIKQKPIKRWDKFVVALITSLAGLIMGYLWGFLK